MTANECIKETKQCIDLLIKQDANLRALCEKGFATREYDGEIAGYMATHSIIATNGNLAFAKNIVKLALRKLFNAAQYAKDAWFEWNWHQTETWINNLRG